MHMQFRWLSLAELNISAIAKSEKQEAENRPIDNTVPQYEVLGNNCRVCGLYSPEPIVLGWIL